MQDGGFVPWEEWKPILHRLNCPCCMGVRFMPDEEELEQIITEHIDMERIQNAILKLEIDTLKKAVGKVENVSGLFEGTGTRNAD